MAIRCSKCRKKLEPDEIFRLKHSKAILCEDCLADYYQCNLCKEYVAENQLADLDIPDYYEDVCLDCAKKYFVQCSDCDCFIQQKSALYHGGKVFCPDCAVTEQEKCTVCQHDFFIDELEVEFLNGKNEYVCRECKQEKIALCSKCNEYFSLDRMVVDDQGKHRCRFCGWKWALTACHHCSKEIPGKDALYVRTPDGDISVCKECAAQHYRRCYGCKMLKPKSETIPVKDVWSCSACRKTVEKQRSIDLLHEASNWASFYIHAARLRRTISNMLRGRWWPFW